MSDLLLLHYDESAITPYLPPVPGPGAIMDMEGGAIQDLEGTAIEDLEA